MLGIEGYEGCRTNAHLGKWLHVESGKIHTSRRTTTHSWKHIVFVWNLLVRIKPILQNVKTYISLKLTLRKGQVSICLGLKHDLSYLTCTYR
jgi:hypothetical protein